MTFKEVKKDYLHMCKIYGDPYDMTGSFDKGEFEGIMLNPTQKNAKKLMVDIIKYGFQHGYFWKTDFLEYNIEDYNDIREIYEKYL